MSERSRHFRAAAPSAAFTLLLVATSPAPDPERRDRAHWAEAGVAGSTARFEATLSVARAAFAAGGRVVMPSDRGMSPIVAALALDYAAAPATERSSEPLHPLVVVDSESSDATLAALLAPYAAHGAVAHVGPEGEPVRLEQAWDEVRLDSSPSRRQPVTEQLVERWQPAGAVFVSPHEEAEKELELLQASGIQVAAMAHVDPEHAERWRSHDIMQAFVTEHPGRWADREQAAPGGRRDALEPWAFLAQLLVSTLEH